jgi:hypothetical protein
MLRWIFIVLPHWYRYNCPPVDMWLHPTHYPDSKCTYSSRGRRGRDRMAVGFTTTFAISAYHHWCCEFESRSGRGVQHYVIKFVSDLVFSVSSTNKTDRHEITKILLKLVLNTIKQTNFIVFGLTQVGLEPTTYNTRGGHTNHYTTYLVPTVSCCSISNKE